MKAFSKNMKNVPKKRLSIIQPVSKISRRYSIKNIESSIFFNIFEIKDFRKKMKKAFSKQ